MDNNRNYRSVNGFTIIIFMVIVFGALWMANRMQMHRQEMTYTEFVKQVEAENVTEVYIDQNKAVPTGTVVFALKDTDENRSVNVSNVEKVEKLLDKNEVLYQVSAIPETSMLSDRDHAWRDHAAFLSYEPSGKRGECKSDELRKKPRPHDKS